MALLSMCRALSACPARAAACGMRQAAFLPRVGLSSRAARAQGRQQLVFTAANSGQTGSSGGEEAASATAGPTPAWEMVQRVSQDALGMMSMGDNATSEIILRKGIAEVQEAHPGDPSLALLHTQLWNLLTEALQHDAALEQAETAHNLMLQYFGDDSADAAFHGIRVGISLVASGGDCDRAQQLLVLGGTCSQHNLEIFWNKLQEMEAAGLNTAEMEMQTRKLMVSLAECNFYGAVGIVRKALQNADELELPMSDLEEAWLGGFKQMGMALPPEHPYFNVAMDVLGRLVPDAAGRPSLQAELEDVLQRLRELLYLAKQMPDSMKAGQEQQGGGGQEEQEFLP